MTFLQGPKGCKRQKLAEVELPCVIAGVVRVFEIRLADGQGGEPSVGGLFTRSLGGAA
jgi:hypothetical protein